MRTFATYIEYLLMTRHYCYVPGKGAFMLRDESATMGTHPNIGADSRRIHRLEAPRRIIHFSPLHHHDDGMLANLLMEAEGMSYDEASRYINRQAGLLPENFAETASLHIDTENFGYGTLDIETWGDIEARLNNTNIAGQNATGSDAKIQNADVISIPRRWVQRVAVVLLIAVCFFASFLGLDDQSTQQQYANILDLSVLQHGSNVSSHWEESDIEDDEDGQSAGDELGDVYAYDAEYDAELWSDEEVAAFASVNNAESKEEIAEEVDSPAEISAPKTTDSPAVKLADTNTTTDINVQPKNSITMDASGYLYYIIVASCADLQDANRALGNMQKQGYNEVNILTRDNRYRLYINSFGSRTEAEAYLKTLRQNSNFQNAWLLPVREASLSSIIKNTYNDNQLFMELSHLNKRTERDQG